MVEDEDYYCIGEDDNNDGETFLINFYFLVVAATTRGNKQGFAAYKSL